MRWGLPQNRQGSQRTYLQRWVIARLFAFFQPARFCQVPSILQRSRKYGLWDPFP